MEVVVEHCREWGLSDIPVLPSVGSKNRQTMRSSAKPPCNVHKLQKHAVWQKVENRG